MAPSHDRTRGGVMSLRRQPETGVGPLPADLTRRLVAEALGTGLLIVAVIGSGIMATRLSPGEIGLQLLENAAATAGALVALIWMLGAVSGAHFNPVVTLLDRSFGAMSTRDTGLYLVAQALGGCVGVCRRHRRQPDVRPPRHRLVHQRPLVRGAVAVRSRRHRRAAANVDSLSIDQQYALKLAANTLHDEFATFVSTETIQLWVETSYDQFADGAKFTNFL